MKNQTYREIHESKNGKVSDKWDLYLDEYHNELAKYRSKQISILEIGVQNGGSLEVWAEYFPLAERITGCDIEEKCSELKYDDKRIEVFIGDATSETVCEQLCRNGNYDIILDDGAHTSESIIKSFIYLFENLNYGGKYIVEDLHCSYWERFQGGLKHPNSSMAFFKKIADIINYEHWNNQQSRVDLLRPIIKEYNMFIDDSLLADIHSIKFTNSMCIIEKVDRKLNLLGRRRVKGVEASVNDNVISVDSLHTSHPNQLGNKWSNFLESIEHQYYDLKIKFNETYRNFERVSEDLNTLTIQKSKIIKDNSILADDLNKLQTEKESLLQKNLVAMEDINKLETENDFLQKKNSETKEELNELANERRKLIEKHSITLNDLNKLIKEKEHLLENNHEIEERLSIKIAEFKQLKTDFDVIESKKNNLESIQSTMKNNLDEKVSIISSLRESIIKQETLLNKTNMELNSLKTIHKDILKENERLKRDFNIQIESNANLKSRKKDIETLLQEKTKLLIRKEKEIYQKSSELKMEKMRLGVMEKDMKSMKNEIRNIDDKVRVLLNDQREKVITKHKRLKIFRGIRRLFGFIKHPRKSRQYYRDAKLIINSGLFDESYYLNENIELNSNPDLLRHFLLVGYKEFRNPHPLFDIKYYLDNNSDIKRRGINPLIHYLKYGAYEGRKPHPLFDSRYYLNSNPDVAKKSVNPLSHYLRKAKKENRKPHVIFDTTFYLKTYPDIKKSRINPLIHFIKYGIDENRNPHPKIDIKQLKAQYQNIKDNNFELLVTKGIEFINEKQKQTHEKIMPVDKLDRSKQDITIVSDSRHEIFNKFYQIKNSSIYKNRDWEKVVLVYSHNLSGKEGAPNSLYEMIVGLFDKGIFPIVISPTEGDLAQKYMSQNIPVIISELFLSPFQKIEAQNNILSINLQMLLENINKIIEIDDIISNTVIGFHIIDAAKRIRKHSVWIIRESENPTAKWLNRLSKPYKVSFLHAINDVDHLVFVSNETKKLWDEHFDNKSDNRLVIHNGINLKRFEKSYTKDKLEIRESLGVTKNELLVLCVGTVSERKNQKQLIESLIQLPKDLLSRIRVFLVGIRLDNQQTKDYYNDIVKFIELNPQLKDRVDLVFETQVIGDYYKAADVFVLTSLFESYPRVIIEAMSFGLPIIANPIFGVLEQTEEHVNALYYNPKKTKSLTKCLSTICDDLRRSELEAGTLRKYGTLTDYDSMVVGFDNLLVRNRNHIIKSDFSNSIEFCTVLKPAFESNNIAALFSTNDAFSNYLGVAIESLIENVSNEHNYDIIVLHTDLKIESAKKLFCLARNKENISIRFIDMSSHINKLPKDILYVEGYVPPETYNKFLLSDILSNYKKCLYLDSDLIFTDDIAKLHNIDLEGNTVAASLNIANISAVFRNKKIKDRDFKEYITKTLGVVDYNKYFQAGVVLVDLEQFIAGNYKDKLLQKLAEVKTPIYFDQCIYNSVFYGNVKFFSTSWNHVWYIQKYAYLIDSVPKEAFYDYAHGRINPKIIHFASKDKPSNRPTWALSEYFWKYASRTIYFSEILEDAKKSVDKNEQLVITEKLCRGNKSNINLLVHLHLFYTDQLDYMLEKLQNIKNVNMKIVISMIEHNEDIVIRVKSMFEDAEFLVVDNIGYDIYPFLEVIKLIHIDDYDYILKIHTKNARPKGRDVVYGKHVPGYDWRNQLIDALIGSENTFTSNIFSLESDPRYGAIGASDFIYNINNNDELNTYDINNWKSKFDIRKGERFFGGSMFLAKAYPFQRFQKMKISKDFFGTGKLQTKDHKNFAHVIERFLGLVVENENLKLIGR